MKLAIAFSALTFLVSGSALADSLRFAEIPITGKPTGGYHVINIDGAECKLKSAAMVGSHCNYDISNPGIEPGGEMVKGPWVIKPMQDNGCSTACE